MPRMRPQSILLIAAILLAACGGSATPDFPRDYADRLQTAWDLAGRGENPTHACSVVVGFAVGRSGNSADARPEAARAFQACYVDIAARYLDVRLGNSGGPEACGQLLGYTTIARMSLGGFAGEIGLDRAELDRQLADRIGIRVRQACPDLADSILGA